MGEDQRTIVLWYVFFNVKPAIITSVNKYWCIFHIVIDILVLMAIIYWTE